MPCSEIGRECRDHEEVQEKLRHQVNPVADQLVRLWGTRDRMSTVLTVLVAVLGGVSKKHAALPQDQGKGLDKTSVTRRQLKVDRELARSFFLNEKHDFGVIDPEITKGKIEELWHRFVYATADSLERSIFITRGGHVGLGPWTTQTGDHVVALFGAGWPFILSPQDAWWHLREYCFVENFMDGEAVRQREAAGMQSEVFEIP